MKERPKSETFHWNAPDYVLTEQRRKNVDINRCPRCSGPIRCLGGESAHPDNWYCADTKCGWEAWTARQQVNKKDKKKSGTKASRGSRRFP